MDVKVVIFVFWSWDSGWASDMEILLSSAQIFSATSTYISKENEY
jgi:hypothetical protein